MVPATWYSGWSDTAAGANVLETGSNYCLEAMNTISFLAEDHEATAGSLPSIAIATNPGDCIIFDPRILHSGSYIEALKLSMFVGFGVQSDHFADLQNYYRHVRPELGYGEFSDELIAYLEERGLFADGIEDTDDLPGAYVPPAALRKIVEKRTSASSSS